MHTKFPAETLKYRKFQTATLMYRKFHTATLKYGKFTRQKHQKEECRKFPLTNDKNIENSLFKHYSINKPQSKHQCMGNSYLKKYEAQMYVKWSPQLGSTAVEV